MALTLLRHATQKPPPGVRGDGGHPLCPRIAWLFNEIGSQSINDACGSMRAGTFVSGGPTWDSGTMGPHLTFNGSTYISVPNHDTDLVFGGFGDVFSIAAWIKRSDVSAGNAHTIFSMGAGTVAGANIDIANSVDTFRLVLAGTAIIASSTTTITDQLWHHLVATKNGADVHLYIDAVDVTGTVANATCFNAQGSWFIGNDPANTGSAFEGGMASLMLWPWALAAPDVGAIFGETYAAFQTRPLQRWFSVGPPGVPPGWQSAFPSADLSLGLWTDQAGGVSNIYTAISETAYNDATYVQSPAAPSNAPYVANFQALATPGAGTPVLRYRFTRVGTGSADMVVDLMQDASTVIQSWTHTNVASGAVVEADQNITGTVTDWSSLRGRITANEP